MIHLSVSKSFGDYQRGDIIIDPAEIAALKSGPHAHDVVQVISKPEHLSGDFFRNDAELAEKRSPKMPIASAPAAEAK